VSCKIRSFSSEYVKTYIFDPARRGVMVMSLCVVCRESNRIEPIRKGVAEKWEREKMRAMKKRHVQTQAVVRCPMSELPIRREDSTTMLAVSKSKGKQSEGIRRVPQIMMHLATKTTAKTLRPDAPSTLSDLRKKCLRAVVGGGNQLFSHVSPHSHSKNILRSASGRV
jgi:hypothetical protein